MDDRIKILAGNLVNHSCRVRKGEKVFIRVKGSDCKPLARQIIKEVYRLGAHPFIKLEDPSLEREMMLGCSQEQERMKNENELELIKRMDVHIGLSALDNFAEKSDVPADRVNEYLGEYRMVVDEIIDKTRWVVARYPNNAMAQKANMSLEGFEDYYFKVCNLDYSRMYRAMEPLCSLMDKTDRVRIVGEGTDLAFSIRNMPAIACAGKENIPDGEIYTAPVRDSVNGVISYNVPSNYRGYTFRDVRFEIDKGKIVDARANDTGRINDILDSDEGARYFGEFAIGVNPYIVDPLEDIIFDEKIMGSIHLTPGNAYKDAFNGNTSKVHWDLIQIQTPEYGGGDLYFDDVLVRKNGRFVIPELFSLNPENLK